jgi:hypothetical protein
VPQTQYKEAREGRLGLMAVGNIYTSTSRKKVIFRTLKGKRTLKSTD